MTRLHLDQAIAGMVSVGWWGYTMSAPMCRRIDEPINSYVIQEMWLLRRRGSLSLTHISVKNLGRRSSASAHEWWQQWPRRPRTAASRAVPGLCCPISRFRGRLMEILDNYAIRNVMCPRTTGQRRGKWRATWRCIWCLHLHPWCVSSASLSSHVNSSLASCQPSIVTSR